MNRHNTTLRSTNLTLSALLLCGSQLTGACVTPESATNSDSDGSSGATDASASASTSASASATDTTPTTTVDPVVVSPDIASK